MRAFVVIAHPLADSLCKSLAKAAIATLRERGHAIDVLDLYDSGFDPVLTADERRAYYGNSSDQPESAQQLRDAEILLLVFPTWWFGLPAILKGWFDRVWIPGTAFDNAPDNSAIVPRLTSLRHAVAITTLGSPRWVDWLVLRQPVKRILKRAIIGACAPQAKFHYLALHGAEAVSALRFDQFAAKIVRVLNTM